MRHSTGRHPSKRDKGETFARETPVPMSRGIQDGTRIGGTRKARTSQVPAMTARDVSQLPPTAQLTVVRKSRNTARAHSATYRTVPSLAAILALYDRLDS